MMSQVVAALAAGLAVSLFLPPSGGAVGRLGRPARRRWSLLQGAGRLRVAAALVAAAVAWLLFPVVIAPAVAAVVAWSVFPLLPVSRPARTALREQLPMTLDFLAVALDAGRPVALAVEAVGAVTPQPTSDLLRRVGGQLALGRPAPEAWRELGDDPVWGQVARDIARSEQSGTLLADVLRTHAEDARTDHREDAVKAARKVGVRSVVPLMACFLPAFILVGVVPIVAGLLRDFFG